MAEYIDREAAIKQFITNGSVFVYGVKGVAAIISRLRMLPKADVVEVVRCKECHYGRELDKDEENYQEGYYECRLCENGDCNPCDHYCSYGFKKGE